MKDLKKTDGFFLAAILVGLFLHLLFLFSPHFLYDETFYASIPFRLAQGDSLVRDEWHLSQFSSLFSFLPVRLWILLKGSADGMIVYLRCVYLAIHTAAAVLIYRFFRVYKQWTVIAAFLFYLQIPYKIYAISYNSMFVLFLLFLTLCLLSIYQKGVVRYHVLAGACFGACCVNNPLFCIVYLLYFLLCALWKKRDAVLASRKARQTKRAQKEKTGKARRAALQTIMQKHAALTASVESYACFFTKRAILFSALGIALIALVSMLFFFATGGTLASIAQNTAHLLQSSEYGITSVSMIEKLRRLWTAINAISFHAPFLLPLLFLALLLDKKRTRLPHRLIYLVVTVLLSALFVAGMVRQMSFRAMMLSLPFALLSIVCYVLTEKKNTRLFLCMWCPCAIASAAILFASNTLLSSVGIVLAISNVAGAFFVRDLIAELRAEREGPDAPEVQSLPAGRLVFAAKATLCLGLCLQIGFYGFALQFKQLPPKDPVQPAEGPFAGMRMTEQQYDAYQKSLHDLDLIKARSGEKDPVLIVSYQNWMYLYTGRPMAVYTPWFYGRLRMDDLRAYYKTNPAKIPKYIYLVNRDREDFNAIDCNNIEENMETLREMFDFSEETLSDGVLLTVTAYKPEG